jgi:hypothetical protein
MIVSNHSLAAQVKRAAFIFGEVVGVWKSDAERLEAEKRIRKEIVEEIRSVCGNCKKLKKIPGADTPKLTERKNRRRKNLEKRVIK